MNDDTQASSKAIEALRTRFEAQSRKAQAYYTVMHRARSVTGTDEAANAWMNAPLAGFGDKTPAQLVSDGREEDVLDYIAGLQSGSPG